MVDTLVDHGRGYISRMFVSDYLEYGVSLCIWGEFGHFVCVYCDLGDCKLSLGADRDG